MRILPLVIIFLVIGGFVIAHNYNLNLKKSEDRRSFIGKFSIWVFNVGKNVVKTVGYVVKLDWLPSDNEVDQTPEKEKIINYSNYIVEE